MTPQPTTQPGEQRRAGTLRSGWWAAGLALAERPAPPNGPTPTEETRVAGWRAAFGTSERFTARLATLGLDEKSLRHLAAESPETLAERAERPVWVDTVEQALLAARPTQVDEPDWRTAFAVPLRPFVANATADLLARTETMSPAIADRFAQRLSRHLVGIAARTLSHESTTNANDLATRLTEAGELANLLAGYPVLARLLAHASTTRTDAMVELLARFTADRDAIVDTLLGGVDPGTLTDVETSAGDGHQGGRAVAILTFATGRQVVYKPRDITAHQRFSGALTWLNQAVPGLDLYAVPALPRDGYGWLAHVPSLPLPDLDAADRFYRRHGALLALLHAFYAADFHLENVIACGDQPVLVDVETLFHPSLAAGTGDPDPAARLLSDSVQRTGLLPVTMDGSVDVSGLSGAADNLPRLDGEVVDVADHDRALLDGFRLVYDTITRHRTEFAALLTTFADAETRVAVRHSRGYVTLLTESTRPELLTDALDRDAAFDLLWTESVHHPLRWLVVPHEQTDLWAMDIPLFTTRPASADLWSADGQRLPNVLAAPGLAVARERLDAMGDMDRRDQEWVISAALATRAPAGGHRAAPARGHLAGTAAPPERLLAAACGLADQIVARGLEAGERLNWLGVEPVDERQWLVLPMGAGLACGYVGVALFLAEVSELSGIPRYGEAARRALAAAPRMFAMLASRPDLIAAVGRGGLHGFGGIAYGLARLTTLLGDDELRAVTRTAVGLAASAPGGPGIATGDAGCLAAMTAVHAELGLPEAAALADDCARRLAGVVRDTDAMAGGFADGAAGIAWALAGRDDEAARIALSLVRTAPDGFGWCTGVAGLAVAGAADPAPLLTDRPVLTDLSLCHGELGIAEALTVLATTGDRPERVAAARRRRAGLVLDAIHQYGATCGTPDAVPTPGLLSGLAGIGYGLLRLGFAERVPSALLFEPSRSTTSHR